MARLMLDSTVLIDALRGRPAAQRLRTLRRTGVEPWACVISVEEIWRGLRPEEEPGARRLFNGLRIAPLARSELEPVRHAILQSYSGASSGNRSTKVRIDAAADDSLRTYFRTNENAIGVGSTSYRPLAVPSTPCESTWISWPPRIGSGVPCRQDARTQTR